MPRRPGTISPDRTQATVAMGFVSGMLAGLQRRHIDPAPLLAATGIDIADTASRIPVDRYAALYNRLNREFDDEGFGLFAQPMRVGSFEFLCRGCLSAPTLAEALTRATRFLHIVLPDLAVSVRRSHGHAELVIAETRKLAEHTDDPGRIFAFEWLLRLLHGLSCWLAGRGISLDSVIFPYRQAGPFRRLRADLHRGFPFRPDRSRWHRHAGRQLQCQPARPAGPPRRSRADRLPRRRARQDHHALPARPRNGDPRPRPAARSPAGFARSWRCGGTTPLVATDGPPPPGRRRIKFSHHQGGTAP